MRIPTTVVSNDVSVIREFVSSVNGQVLFKPVSGFAPRSANFVRELSAYAATRLKYELYDDMDEDQIEVVFSQLLTDDKIAHLESIEYCPAIFQEYIAKRMEIRVTVVDQEVFACEIHSQSTPETSIDFRRIPVTNSLGRVPHRVHKLPASIVEKLLGIMSALGITFGCFDLVLTPDDEYVFLEVNPSDQWLWIEQLTGLQICNSVASLLARKRRLS